MKLELIFPHLPSCITPAFIAAASPYSLSFLLSIPAICNEYRLGIPYNVGCTTLGFLCPAKPSFMVPQPLSNTTALLKWEPATSKHIKKLITKINLMLNKTPVGFMHKLYFQGQCLSRGSHQTATVSQQLADSQLEVFSMFQAKVLADSKWPVGKLLVGLTLKWSHTLFYSSVASKTA